MREIGIVAAESDATRFADYLASLGISARVLNSESGAVVWARDEQQLDKARDEFAAFVKNPQESRYVDAAAFIVAKRELLSEKQFLQPPGPRPLSVTKSRQKHCPLTLALIAVSIPGWLFQSDLAPSWGISAVAGPLTEIRAGEWWRLVTPIFLHMSPLHFAFNMSWLLLLGWQVEQRLGSFRYLALILIVAAGSNFGQWALGPAVAFGGMSGVVYGLFGYALVRSRLEPESGHRIPTSGVVMLLGWLVFCSVGEVPGIANEAHAVGLAIGAAMGVFASYWG